MSELLFEVYSAESDQTALPTKRKGFVVEGIGEIAGANVICFEGYRLHEDDGGGEVIEAGLLEPYLMIVPDALSGRGVGTALLARAFREAAERGFGRGRLHIENPAVVTILRHLLEGDTLTAAHFYRTSNDPSLDEGIASSDLREYGNTITAEEASIYLNSIALNEYGMRDSPDDDSIHCLVEF